MTATALAVTLPVADRTVVDGHDPMETRWAIQCGVRDKNLDSWRAGFTSVPFGEFFAVSRFRTPKEIHSTDDNPNFPRSQLVTEPAQEVEVYLKEMLGGTDGAGNPAPNKLNFGIQFGFRGDEDFAKVAVISATVLPKLQVIRAFAENSKLPNPIGPKCDAQEAGDFEERATCPTCWAAWIDSELCTAHIKAVAASGMNCAEYDPVTGETNERLVRPSMADLEVAREMAKTALHAGLKANRQIWTTLVEEQEKGERRGIDQYQHNIRRDVHGTKVEDKQVAMVREFGRASQQGGNDSSDMTAILKMMAESQVRSEQLLAQVLGNRSTGSKPVEVDVPATEPAKAAPPKNGGK